MPFANDVSFRSRRHGFRPITIRFRLFFLVLESEAFVLCLGLNAKDLIALIARPMFKYSADDFVANTCQ